MVLLARIDTSDPSSTRWERTDNMRLRTPERRRSRALRLIANHAAARSLGSLRASAIASAAAIASATPELRLRPPSGANW